MQNYIELFDNRLGDAISGPITVNFSHEFDRPVQRVTLKNGTILVGSMETVKDDALIGETSYVVDVGTEQESNPVAIFQSEVRKVDEYVPGNHQITGVTTCTIVCPKTGQTFTGEALCGREDRYNRRLGRALSFFRAWFSLGLAGNMSASFAHQGTSAFIARNYRVFVDIENFKEAQDTILYGLPSAYPEFKYVNSAMEALLDEHDKTNPPSIPAKAAGSSDEDIIMNLVMSVLSSRR